MIYSNELSESSTSKLVSNQRARLINQGVCQRPKLDVTIERHEADAGEAVWQGEGRDPPTACKRAIADIN